MQLLVCSKSRALDRGQRYTNLNCEERKKSKEEKQRRQGEKSEPTQTLWGLGAAAARIAHDAATEIFMAIFMSIFTAIFTATFLPMKGLMRHKMYVRCTPRGERKTNPHRSTLAWPNSPLRKSPASLRDGSRTRFTLGSREAHRTGRRPAVRAPFQLSWGKRA